MKLLVQPDDKLLPMLRGIERARKSLEIAIFRSDCKDVERALKNAVRHGVAVHALIACTNGGGENSLRNLEMRLLDYGVSVGRTGKGLSRYHDKLMIVDGKELFLVAFNLTHLDTERSRSFGIVTRNRKLVEDAAKLYAADAKRQNYAEKTTSLVISPLNARNKLSNFIRRARKQLLIYDPKISDRNMVGILEKKAQAGVEIKIIGKLSNNRHPLEVRELTHLRLHTRTMIRDGCVAFLGSQSLRQNELDNRREVGVIFRDRAVVNRLSRIFQDDWAVAVPKNLEDARPGEAIENTARRVSKTVAEELPPVAPALESALEEIAGMKVNGSLDRRQVEATVKGTVKQAVASTVESVVKELIEEQTNADSSLRSE